MKHKHYDMIVAKAANTELVVFYYTPVNDKWIKKLCQDDMDFEEGVKYFLCLPQHNENGQCLHWLNGGQIKLKGGITWSKGTPVEWHLYSPFMSNEYDLSIKPRKEKRWVAIDVNRGDVAMCTENSVPAPGYQIIEIEVEV